MRARLGWAFLAAVLAAGCIHDDLITCGDSICPVSSVCLDDRCVTRDQLTACDGFVEGAACMLGAVHGFCFGGACFPAFCGDGVVQPGEVCDDGNEVGGDGCSAHCDSVEVCGNAVIDYVASEQCDDGGAFTGDGCSSRCELEYDVWRDVSPALLSQRGGFAIAYDVLRRETVVFGGGKSHDTSTGVVSEVTGDTWAWDGITWGRRTPLTSPKARSNAGLAYDAGRGVFVLFGGSTGASELQDLWELDAVTLEWVHRTDVTTLPGARSAQVLVYDPGRAKTVMYGGMASGSPLNETWEYNGATWVHPATPTAPTGPISAAGCYDELRGGVAITGGRPSLAVNPTAEAWSWNGVQWSAPLNNPSGRTHAGLVFDRARGVLVQFGGFTSTTAYNTVLEYNTSWLTNTGDIDPGALQRAAAAYDAARHRLVVFGGMATSTGRYETWEWDGVSWRQRLPVDHPLGRLGHAMAYDEHTGEVVMFGGLATAIATTPKADTWLWDGTNWRDSLATGPPGRLATAMAYDAVRQRVVLFGGTDPLGTVYADTWEWDGATWTLLAPAHSPPAVTGHAMAFDRGRGTVVLYGGNNVPGSPTAGELWEWDGSDWTQLHPGGDPPLVLDAGMAYDPVRRTLMVFGGLDALTGVTSSAVWETDAATWRLRAPAISPPPRQDAVLAYDPVAHQLVAYGGGNETTATSLQDTWAYGFQAATRPDLCIDVDTDGDGLTGCADPDCWARCTPLCPPGATCDETLLPHCGDGTCSRLEDPLLCSVDCP